MNGKSPDAFRTISEVADWLDRPAHVLRFWESKFTQVKPVKRAGGRRYYRPEDMRLLGGIKKLLHDDGMTIKGAQKVLREQGVRYVSALSAPLDDDDVMVGMALDVTGAMVTTRRADHPTGHISTDFAPDDAPADDLDDDIGDLGDVEMDEDPIADDNQQDLPFAPKPIKQRPDLQPAPDPAPRPLPQSDAKPEQDAPEPAFIAAQDTAPEVMISETAAAEALAVPDPSPAPAPIDALAPQLATPPIPAPQTAILGRLATLTQPVPVTNRPAILALITQLDALAARWAPPHKA